MLLLNMDRTSNVSLYQQAIRGIIGLIESSSLEPGTRLPSTRSLSEKLGVNRSTIYRAYQELLALGYVDSRPGSYTTVRKRMQLASTKGHLRRSIINWQDASTLASNKLYQNFLHHSPELDASRSRDIINLSRLHIDMRLFPVKDFRRSINHVMIDAGAELLDYGEFAGYRPLREYIAHRLQMHGISVTGDHILITNGSQQALELVMRLLAGPGKKVVIEAPTYANVIPLLRYFQVGIVEVPVNDEGLDLNMLERQLRKEPPAFIYTIPNFQNPTGITTSQTHRERLLALAEKYKVPIVEDGFEEEMKYFGKVVLPIKSMDKYQLVIYLGTFSKVLFPGIRVGWIAADRECIDRLTALKRFSDLAGNTVTQAAVHHFSREGYYDLHIKRLHRIFRRRMVAALAAIKENFPANVRCTRPDGGYTLWATLHRSYGSVEILKRFLLKHKVFASPGAYFFHSSCPHKYLRISISNLDEDQIKEGIVRLGKALHDLSDHARKGS